jgi:hypothetical protein
MIRGRIRRCLLAATIVLPAFASVSMAAPTSAAQARKVAHGWLRLEARPLGANLGAKVDRVETFPDSQGQPAYHVVYLDPTGFLIVSADDDVEPIVAIVSGDTYDPSPDNPLREMVENDVPVRVAAARMAAAPPVTGVAPAGQAGPVVRRGLSQSNAKWQRLAADQGVTSDPLPPPGSAGSISDVRVAPLTQSHWDQSTACGTYCYNYYTPNHYVCGCTATAFAQVLRYYQFPTAGIGVNASAIFVDGVSQTAYTRGGDGVGGPYDWGQMPLAPSCSITTAQRQAIGSLCYDAGVLVHMQYAGSGSGAWIHDATTALRGALGYGNAITGWASTDAPRNAMLNPSLDAGHPCLLAIYNATVGHAVVVDGYGYNLSTLYHHLNMGWSGGSDAWYNLPNVDCSYNFYYITECVYNIFTTGTGEIISGRVTDQVGRPVPGASVTVLQAGGSTWTVTCNAKSMYVLPQVPSATTFTLTPSATDYTFTSQTITTGTSADYSSTTGNRWIDLPGTPAWPEMWVTPSAGLTSIGTLVGGPVTPTSVTYTVSNVGGQSLDWTAGNTSTWLTLARTSGALAAGQTDTVVASLNSGAYSLPGGSYSDTITFTNTTNSNGNTTRPVSLSIPIPPAPITNLAVAAIDATTIELTWTATGADGNQGTATSYDLRYSPSPITSGNFDAATQVTGTPAPKAAGSPEQFTVTGLTPSTTYYFAIKAKDAAGNMGDISNVASATALPPDATSPAWVGDLTAIPSKTAGGVDLAWTAPGDDGLVRTASRYDLRYSTSPILWSDDDATWNAATTVAGLPAPKAPGQAETFTVTDLTGGTTYYFAVRTADEVPNLSEVSNCAPARASSMGERTLQVGLNGYTGCYDSYILGGSPTGNNSTLNRMVVCGFADLGSMAVQRSLVKFDVSSLPAGTQLSSATLYLYSYDAAQVKGNTGFYGVYPLACDWADTQVTWNIAKTGTNWITAGGDFAAAPDATSPKQAVAGVWYPFDVTARVQEWQVSPTGNFGWLVKCTDEMLHNQDRFYQSESALTALRPKLVVSDLAPAAPSDIDADGVVDVMDLLIFVDSFAAILGTDRNYDPRCDFSGDGAVDVVDLLTFVGYWPQ